MEQESINKPMTDDELVSVCMEEAGRGIGGGLNAENDSDISLPLDYYFGRLPSISKNTAKDANSSRYVSMDVMDAVEATKSEIMPALTTDEIAFFVPSGEDDEEQAAAETSLLNYLFFEQYDGHILLQQAVTDVCLHRNCTGKVYWDERVKVEYEEFDGVPALALPMVLQPKKENQQVEIVHQEVDSEEVGEGLDPDVIAENLTYSIKIKRMTMIGKPVIETVPPEEVGVNGDHNSPYLHNARFPWHEKIETVSSMIEQGFDPDIIKKLPEYNSKADKSSRSRESEEFDSSSAHSSTKLIRIFEFYPLIDFDGDGIAERRKVVIGDGDHMLSNDEWDSVPLVGGVGTVVPHKYKGVSLFERIKQIQDSKTPLIRSIIDGTQLAANPRIGVITGEANIDDLLTSRTGGIVRADSAAALFDVPNPEVPMSAYSLIDFMDNQRRERGGGAIGQANQAGKTVGQGGDFALDRIMTSMELSNAMVARTLGETFIRGIFIQLHDIIRKNHKGDLSARVGGKWVKSAPEEWQQRANVSVQIGSSHAERTRQGNVMREVVAMQKELAMSGSVMFDEDKAYTAISDAIKLSGIKAPERYFTDPSSPEGEEKGQQKDQQNQQAEQEQKQMQIAMAQANLQMAEAEQMKGQANLQAQAIKAENEALKRELDEQKAFIEAADKADKTQFDYDKLVSDAALRLTELEVAADRDLSQQNKDNRV